MNWPRALLRIWIVFTIGWLGLAGYHLFMGWPQYSRLFHTPDNPLYGAMVRKHVIEYIGSALIPAVAFVIGWLVLRAVRGPRKR